MEDVTLATWALLEDNEFNRADNEAEELLFEVEALLYDIKQAVYNLERACASGDLAHIEDATYELKQLLRSA